VPCGRYKPFAQVQLCVAGYQLQLAGFVAGFVDETFHSPPQGYGDSCLVTEYMTA